MPIGRKIRDLRLRRGLTVQRLADATGLSKGFISQVENDRTSPSLATLRDLAAALGTSMAWLVVEDHPTPQVVRAAERPQLPAEDGARTEVLSALPGRNLELLARTLPPGPPAGTRQSRPGEVCLLCLEGRVRVLHGEQELLLETGDSCHFDGRVPYATENAGPAPARLIVAATPPVREPSPRPVPAADAVEASTTG